MFCLAPILLIGAMSGIETSWHHLQHVPKGELIEFQTCLTGPGLVGTLAPSSGLYGIGAQWGFSKEINQSVRIGFTPQIGISSATTRYKELPMGTQFEVGGALWVNYDKFVINVKYWHLSNAGMHNTDRQPNKGLDMVGIMGGYIF